MALLHVNFYSRTLERETQMDVILPVTHGTNVEDGA